MSLASAYAGAYLKPPRIRNGLAVAMGGDPFGFQRYKNTTGYRDPLAALTPSASFPKPQQPYSPPAPRTVPAAVVPSQAPNTAPTAEKPQTSSLAAYDISTDPALQQVYAYTGQADAQAQSQALADKTRLIEQAGLGDLAAALGLGSDVASVASGNPFSSAANLRHTLDLNTQDLTRQNQQNSTDLTNQLNPANLIYGTYAKHQRQNLADAFNTAASEQNRQYQQGLSDLAAAIASQIAGINSSLAGTLGLNLQQRIAAEQAARDRAAQNGGGGGNDNGGSPGQNLSVAQAIQNYGIGLNPEQRLRFIGGY